MAASGPDGIAESTMENSDSGSRRARIRSAIAAPGDAPRLASSLTTSLTASR